MPKVDRLGSDCHDGNRPRKLLLLGNTASEAEVEGIEPRATRGLDNITRGKGDGSFSRTEVDCMPLLEQGSNREKVSESWCIDRRR